MRAPPLIGVAAALLAGCASTEPGVPTLEPSAVATEGERVSEQIREDDARRARLSEYSARCRSYRYVEGTTEFSDCMRSEAREAEQVARDAAAARRSEQQARDARDLEARLERERHERDLREQRDRDERLRKDQIDAKRQAAGASGGAAQPKPAEVRQPLVAQQCPRPSQPVIGCVLFEDAKFAGSCVVLKPQEKLQAFGTFDNRASSVRLKQGCSLLGYNEPELKGKLWKYSADAPALPIDQDNKISSAVCECR